MSDNTLIFFSVVMRGLCVLAAIAGAVYLASQDRAGWGWLIFLAICIGSYSIEADSDKPGSAEATQNIKPPEKGGAV